MRKKNVLFLRRWKISGDYLVTAAGTMILGAEDNYVYAGATITIVDLIYSSIRNSRNKIEKVKNHPLAYAYIVDKHYSDRNS